jgi:hypothetical protein
MEHCSALSGMAVPLIFTAALVEKALYKSFFNARHELIICLTKCWCRNVDGQVGGGWEGGLLLA